MAREPLRVMLVDDHAVVRMGLRLLLDAVPGMRVASEADSGEEALRLYPEVDPDVVVMDISMPGIGGLETLGRIMVRHPDARILILSAHADAIHARRFLKAGAAGYLSKRSAGEELVRAIEQVVRGKTFIEPAIAQQLAMQQLGGDKSPVEKLTEKEFKVFLELAQGRSVAEIAGLMSLSPHTIGTHLYNIKQKLDASNQAELTLIAVRAGLIEP